MDVKSTERGVIFLQTLGNVCLRSTARAKTGHTAQVLATQRDNGACTNKNTFTGPNFIHPHPPTPENTLLGVGACIKREGGRIKFLPRGASKYTPPPPSPEKCLLAKNGGGGGGAYIISPWNIALQLRRADTKTQTCQRS